MILASKWAQFATTEPIETEEAPTQPSSGSKWAKFAEPPKEIFGGGEPGEPSGAGSSYNTWIDTLTSAALNTPKSAYEYGKGIYEAIIHPIQTAKGINEAFGTIEVGSDNKLKHAQFDETLNQIAKFMEQRYGSVEKFQDTLSKDPVGVMADISTVVMPLGKVAGVPKLAKFGAALEPTNIALKGAALPLKLIPESVPTWMYQSAVKFGTTLTAEQRKAVTKTALVEKIMPTNKGMLKLKDKIDDFNTKITERVNDKMYTGNDIKVEELYRGLEEIKDKMKQISDEPLGWESAFDGIKAQLEEASKTPIRTPMQVQKIKQNIYKQLSSYYEKLKSEPAKTYLRKEIARNARKALEEIIPEIKQLNAKEGVLIDLWDAVGSKANRITNRDLIGIGLPIKMGTGAGVGFMVAGETGGQIGTQLGFILGVFDTPQVKAKLALVLNRLMEKGTTVKLTPAAARLTLFQSGKSIKEEGENKNE